MASPDNNLEFQQKLIAGDGASGDQFGFTVTGTDSRAIVSAYKDDGERGAIYVFDQTAGAYAQSAKIIASDGTAGDWFGLRADFDNGLLAVAAPLADRVGGTNTGAVYVYEQTASGFGNEAKLVAAASQVNGFFAEEVSVSGNTIVAGASKEDSRAGAVYVFERIGGSWVDPIRLTASDAAPDRVFGEGLAIDGDTIAVGANFDNVNGFRSGSVYIFNRQQDGTWLEEPDKIVAPDGAANDEFGSSVSLSGDTLVVGSWYDDAGVGFRTGSIHIYERTGNGWEHAQRLLASDPTPGAVFSGQVNIEGDRLLVAAGSLDNGRGATYVFERAGEGWVQTDKIVAPDGQPNDSFGYADFVDDDIVVGAFGVNDRTGAAYVFAPENEAPIAVDDSFAIPYGLLATLDILDNDSDPDGDGLDPASLNIVDPAIGEIVLMSDGRVEYTPDAGFVGTDSFVYTVQDDRGATSGLATAEMIVAAPSGAILGSSGDDTSRGGNGADILAGLDGNDVLYGDNANDTLLGNNGDDNLRGDNGNDRLLGGQGKDSLFGGNGNDVLIGGDDADLLTGGLGADQFFLAAGEGIDQILDFKRGSDKLTLLAEDANGLAFATTGASTEVKIGSEVVAIVVGVTGVGLADVLTVPPPL